MLALTTSFFLLAEGGGFYDRIFNIPGFEAWKFLNLAIFVAFMIVDEETAKDVRASAQSLFGLVVFGIYGLAEAAWRRVPGDAGAR